MTSYHTKSPGFIIGSPEITAAKEYLHSCLDRRRTKLNTSEIDDTFNAILLRHKRPLHVEDTPFIPTRSPRRGKAAANLAPVCYAQRKLANTLPVKIFKHSKECKVISDMALSCIRYNKFPSQISLIDHKVEPVREERKKRSNSYGILYNNQEEEIIKGTKKVKTETTAFVAHGSTGKDSFNNKFRQIFSQRVYKINEQVMPIPLLGNREKKKFRKSRSHVKVSPKSGIDSFIDDCESARKVTLSERNRMVKQYYQKHFKVFKKVGEILDFSSNYKKQCVRDFKNSKRAFIYGKEFKGYFINGPYK